MTKRISDAEWRGDLKDGAGTLRLGSEAFEGKYSYKSRFKDGPGTNPEELTAAAHAACFLDGPGGGGGAVAEGPRTDEHPCESDRRFRPGSGRFRDLPHRARNRRPSSRHIDAATFEQVAQAAKVECPVSKALAAVEISLVAKLSIAGRLWLSIQALGIDLSQMAPM